MEEKMRDSQVNEFLKKTKLELKRLPKRGKSGRPSAMPDQLVNDIQKLSQYFSQAELSRRLNIKPARMHRAVKRGTETGKTLTISPSFVKVIQESEKPSLQNSPTKGKIILEMITKSGMTISVFE